MLEYLFVMKYSLPVLKWRRGYESSLWSYSCLICLFLVLISVIMHFVPVF